MPDPHPRYIVCEISGYGGMGGSGSKLSTSLRVADRWYGYVTVATVPGGQGRTQWARRSHAESLCAALNAEHDAWLVDE